MNPPPPKPPVSVRHNDVFLFSASCSNCHSESVIKRLLLLLHPSASTSGSGKNSNYDGSVPNKSLNAMPEMESGNLCCSLLAIT